MRNCMLRCSDWLHSHHRWAVGGMFSLQVALDVCAVASAGTGGGTQQKQAQLWQEWLAWEKSNPQRLDGPALSARVALAYDEALTILYHYPEVRMRPQTGVLA